ncbi:two-component system response regulator CreB [Massilia glaciei]|uniref:Two-component system response regulator CreB n=1 Tax=Massilia glaciei TaxID=1524097 RepID=A0A2U2I519_9BURK|nr:two-component system response regulator CreB [Massilia glaciei]PWF54894.1 two-component system response regulator CreB [Massilia glaciei]
MPQTILIVEDERAIADSIAYALRTDGFAPRHLTLGMEALEAMRAPAAQLPDLIVLDVGLPDMNGFEVCRQLRQFCNVPVIFLTARSDEIDRIVGLEIGADDYVTKPFSPRELVARIRVVLRRLAPPPQQPQPQPPAAAPERFDVRPQEARVIYCGRALELTRYEYLLLLALAEHPGHVLSRSQLMDRVWADAADTLERTVDAHVKSLRAKLRAVDPGFDPIHTHRGMGYSLSKA